MPHLASPHGGEGPGLGTTTPPPSLPTRWGGTWTGDYNAPHLASPHAVGGTWTGGLQRPHLASPHGGEGPETQAAEAGASSRKLGSVSAPVPLRLRPLEIGDVLDETFRMYRRHFLLFAGISVILAIPTAALFGLGFGSLTLALQQAGQADLSSLTPLLASFGAGLLITF